MATLHSLAAALAIALMAACAGGDGSSSDSSTAAAPVAGGSALPYTDGDGIPELTATPVYTPTTVAAHESVTISVAVDSDTRGLVAYVPPTGGAALDGGSETATVLASPSAPTDVRVQMIPYSAAGLYSVHVGVCVLSACVGTDPGLPSRQTTYQPDPANGKYYRRDPAGTSSSEIPIAPSTFRVTASTKGRREDPIVLPLDTDLRGWVKGGGATYYRVETTVGNLYSLLMSEAGQVTLFPVDSTAACGTETSGAQRLICVHAATATRRDYVAGSPLLAGGTYRLLARQHPALGTQAAPSDVTLGTPIAAAVPSNETAYYTVAVTAGKSYSVSMYGSAAVNLDLTSYKHDRSFQTPDCPLANQPFGTEPTEVCGFVAAGATAYFKVADIAGLGGTFTAYAQENAFTSSQGSAAAPVDVPLGAAPLDGHVRPGGTSYYQAAAAAGSHEVQLTHVSAPATLRVRGVPHDAQDADAAFCSSAGTTFGATLTCAYEVTGTTIYFSVSGSALESTYKMTVR